MNSNGEYLENIVNSVADPIFVKDREHRWILFNDAFCEFMGYSREELVGKSDYEYFPKNQADVFWQKDEEVFRAGEENINEEEFTDAKGVLHQIITKKTRYTHTDGKHYIVGVIRDVTELKLLEKQLLESQKLEAVGQLAGGIAHEFNNIMMIIKGYVEIALMRMDDDSAVAADLKEVGTAIKRASDLVSQILAFSRRQMVRPELVELNAFLEKLRIMMDPLVSETIISTVKKFQTPISVFIDPGQLQQVLLNMVVNAEHAMPEGGNLTVSLDRATVEKNERGKRASFKPGDYVIISIEDTGRGIPPEVMPHIFEPFFTTKPTGRGTGLGLAMSYGIVKSAGGYIDAESEPGKGARFEIYLPYAESAVISGGTDAALSESELSGSETVLFAEDEQSIRILGKRILESLGYKVLLAADGIEALVVAAQHQNKIDVLISDIVMPRMGGFTLYKELLKQRSDLKVIFITGYSEEIIQKQHKDFCNFEVLEKPFSRETLAAKIRELLK